MSARTDTEPTPLRRIRQQRGLSQKSLAALTGCAISTVWIAERGRFLSPTMAVRFAKVLGVAPETLQ